MPSARAWVRRTDRFWDFLLGRRPAVNDRRRPPLAALPLEDRVVPAGRPLPYPVIAAGSGPGGPPDARLFDADTGGVLVDVAPFGPALAGGVRVAVADLTRDAFADLVVAAGPGGGPHVRVFDGKTGHQMPGPLGRTPTTRPSGAASRWPPGTSPGTGSRTW
ncbi:MAG: hypothetical protein U0871_09485 [Gemmataceae bacterium]